MSKKFYNITVELLPDDASKFDTKLQTASLYLRKWFSLNSARVVCPMAEGVKKDESLGHLWHDILPKDNNYVFEIATELPYYLPNLDSRPEYILNVRGHKFFICNRMVRAFCGKGLPEGKTPSYLLGHRKSLPGLVQNKEHLELHPLPLKTFVSRKFICSSQSAEEAIQNNFILWRDEFIAQLSFLVDAIRTVNPDAAKYLLPHVAITSFPIFWVAVLGDKDKIGCEQFIGDLVITAHRPLKNITGDSIKQLNILLQNEISIHDAALSLALSFSHYGYYELAVIQVCISCETLLSNTLKQHLKKRGMTKTHIDAYFDDVRLSHLLNLHLPNIINITQLDNHNKILGDLNWARKRRNEILHEGHSLEKLTLVRLEEVTESARKLIDLILSIDDNQM